jgi:hypothetical protein
VDSHGNKPASRSEDVRPGRAGKKAYRSPHLTEYGSVAKLTQNTAGSGADGGMKASQMKSCL